MDVNKLQELNRLLASKQSASICRKVFVELEELGLDSELKGFLYLLDIITLSIIYRKYSRTTIAELTPFIANKYNIKEFSVQRQLRYVCTVKTNGKYKVHDICESIWKKIKTEIENEEEIQEQWKNYYKEKPLW